MEEGGEDEIQRELKMKINKTERMKPLLRMVKEDPKKKRGGVSPGINKSMYSGKRVSRTRKSRCGLLMDTHKFWEG